MPKIGRRVLLALLILLVYQVFRAPIHPLQEVSIQQGDTFAKFTNDFSSRQKFRIKAYNKLKKVNLDNLEVGTYSFSGSYSLSAFIQQIQAGPTQNFIPYTVLEGRSIYDIDADLTAKGLTQAKQYISYVSDAERLRSLSDQYVFLQEAGNIPSLEGFLYPDTYHLDVNTDPVPQLVKLQLQAFQQKIWKSVDLPFFQNKLSRDFPQVKLDRYDIVTLASIIQKEEKHAANQPVIAGIFLNRLQARIRLDADITLCYYFKQPYAQCGPVVIARSISDTNNPFNTRQKAGLPPQAIANIPASAMQAVLEYSKTDFLFYLHDDSGQIHYARTLDQHNANKARYLQ